MAVVDHFSNTTGGRVFALDEHAHKPQQVYPKFASAVTVTGAAGVWTEGAAAEIIPADTITDDFDIHQIDLSAASANDSYVMCLYSDSVCICEISFVKSATSDPVHSFSVTTPILAANSQVTATLASQGGGSDTVDVKLWYHIY